MFTLTSCQISYLYRSAIEQVKILNKKKDISKMRTSKALSKDLAYKFEVLDKARKSLEAQGFEITDKYQTYVELDRPYVSYLLTIAHPYEIHPQDFCFLFGSVCFPYIGYFSLEEAQEKHKHYKEQGFDAYLRGVTAYSSLGYFSDPLLSSMLSGPEYQWVDTLAHESFHGTLFVRNHVEFNESLAVFVAQKFVEFFYKKQPQVLKAQAGDHKFRKKIHEIFEVLTVKMKAWYQSHDPRSTEFFLKRREEYFLKIKNELIHSITDAKLLRFIHQFKVNNARLAAHQVYFGPSYNFENLYKQTQDLSSFLKALKKRHEELGDKKFVKSFLASQE